MASRCRRSPQARSASPWITPVTCRRAIAAAWRAGGGWVVAVVMLWGFDFGAGHPPHPPRAWHLLRGDVQGHAGALRHRRGRTDAAGEEHRLRDLPLSRTDHAGRTILSVDQRDMRLLPAPARTPREAAMNTGPQSLRSTHPGRDAAR